MERFNLNNSPEQLMFDDFQPTAALLLTNCIAVLKDPATSIKKRLRGFFLCMKIMGFAPPSLSIESSQIRRRVTTVLYPFVIVCGLGMISVDNFRVLSIIRNLYGNLHAQTTFSTIAVIKPVICIIILVNFAVGSENHRNLLRTLDNANGVFSVEFGTEPNFFLLHVGALISVFLAGFIAWIFRVVEFIKLGEKFGDSDFYLGEISIVLVGLTNIWLILPLVYFVVIQLINLYWLNRLATGIDKKSPCSGHELKHFYRRFLDLAEIQNASADFFGPWIFLSFAWSVFVLCLMIYFFTQASGEPIFGLPKIKFENYSVNVLRNQCGTMHFNVGWSCMQILIAACHISVICVVGTKVNEQTRAISTTVFKKIAIEEDNETSKFQITYCFVQKIATQYVWGVTVWRMFTIERNVFFTLTSLIFSYSLLLVKFKQTEPHQLPTILCDQLNIFNVTHF